MGSLFENREAEESVIGLILNNEDYRKLIPQIAEEDLTAPEYRTILRALRQIYADKRPVNFVTVGDELVKLAGPEEQKFLNTAMLRAADKAFLAEYHLQDHMQIISRAALRRRMLAALQEARRLLVETNEDTASILDRTRQELRNMVVTSHTWESMPEVLTAAMDQIAWLENGEDKGMPSGIGPVDRQTMGFHKGELTIIGARPAVGKSAFAAQIAMEAAKKGYKVGICSREMTDPAVFFCMTGLSGKQPEQNGSSRGSGFPVLREQCVNTGRLFIYPSSDIMKRRKGDRTNEETGDDDSGGQAGLRESALPGGIAAGMRIGSGGFPRRNSGERQRCRGPGVGRPAGRRFFSRKSIAGRDGTSVG